MIWFILLILICVCIMRVVYVLHGIHNNKQQFSSSRIKDCSTMVVAGSGGHTSEILKLLECLGLQYEPRFYIIADTDIMSEEKIKQFEHQRKSRHISVEKSNFTILHIPRSREVKQSYFTSVFSTLKSSLYSFPLVFINRPDLVLCNGPGTCIPICVAAFILKLLMLKPTVIVFVESVCRVTTMSLSGKILYTFADHCIVQWPQLTQLYPRSRYLGRLV